MKTEWNVDAALAKWSALLLQGDKHLWAKEACHKLDTALPEGIWSLVRRPPSLPKKDLSKLWYRILKAWYRMHPQLEDPQKPQDVLAWPAIGENNGVKQGHKSKTLSLLTNKYKDGG